MAKPSLASMSAEALLKLREDTAKVLSTRANELRVQLAKLSGRGVASRQPGRKSLKGRKVPPKYRDKSGNVWAGRGVQPRWMRAAIKGGAKMQDFLIDKSRPRKKRAAKR